MNEDEADEDGLFACGISDISEKKKKGSRSCDLLRKEQDPGRIGKRPV